MAGVSLLRSGAPRRLGLTKHNNYASLHGDRKPQLDEYRESSLPIDAPPISTSSEEESDVQLVPYDGLSDDSEFGVIQPKKRPYTQAPLLTGTDSSSANGEDGQKRGLNVEPSNIRAGNFTSGTGPGSRNGSQGGQKRKNSDMDDDELPLLFSQHSKKQRQGYGYGSTHKNRGLAKKSGNPTQTSSKESDKAGHSYKTPITDATIAIVDRINAKVEESKKPRWRETPATQNSQRDRRASQRSVKSTQDSSQSSSKGFKQPPRPSPKIVPQFRVSPVVSQEADPPRATRSSMLAKNSSVPTEDNGVKSSMLQNAMNTATDKLGISTMQSEPPASARFDSSAPPTTLDAATTISSPLSSLDDSSLGSGQEGVPIITSEDIPVYEAKSRPAVCPMCKQPVDKSFLEEFSKVDTRMSLRQQTQFCKAHKERSAESEWAERGYPEIDWQQFDIRITKYYTFIDEILSRRTFSFYRNAFEDSLKSGKHRTLQETLMGGDEVEGMSPGYYGGRGAKVMADNIMSRFASKLRRLAASDKLISSGGVSRYVQAVLVPELAVLLIKDDMGVDEDRAREVMRDSVDIGNLLNEEEDEIIAEPAPKEREVIDVM